MKEIFNKYLKIKTMSKHCVVCGSRINKLGLCPNDHNHGDEEIERWQERQIDRLDEDEETHESLTGGFRDPEPPSYGLSDEDELKANFEDLPDEEDDRDEPADPDFDVDSSMEDRISQYEDKYSDLGRYR